MILIQSFYVYPKNSLQGKPSKLLHCLTGTRLLHATTDAPLTGNFIKIAKEKR